MTDYELLTHQCKSLNEEREQLITLRSKCADTIQVINTKLESLDMIIEGNLMQQEIYWPNFNTSDSLIRCRDVVKEFFENPNQTGDEIALKSGMSSANVLRLITNHFTSKGPLDRV